MDQDQERTHLVGVPISFDSETRTYKLLVSVPVTQTSFTNANINFLKDALTCQTPYCDFEWTLDEREYQDMVMHSRIPPLTPRMTAEPVKIGHIYHHECRALKIDINTHSAPEIPFELRDRMAAKVYKVIPLEDIFCPQPTITGAAINWEAVLRKLDCRAGSIVVPRLDADIENDQEYNKTGNNADTGILTHLRHDKEAREKFMYERFGIIKTDPITFSEQNYVLKKP